MYKYIISDEPKKFLQKIPTKHAVQIINKIEKLAENPHSFPHKKLRGYDDLYRIKSGEYRIIYSIENEIIMIYILRIGKRNDGEVYERLENIETQE